MGLLLVVAASCKSKHGTDGVGSRTDEQEAKAKRDALQYESLPGDASRTQAMNEPGWNCAPECDDGAVLSDRRLELRASSDVARQVGSAVLAMTATGGEYQGISESAQGYTWIAHYFSTHRFYGCQADVPLCHGTGRSERFEGQPTLGYCTAFLLGRDDTVVTAGHCLDLYPKSKLNLIRFVLDWGGTARAGGSIDASKVFGVKRVLADGRWLSHNNRRWGDWAVIELSGHTERMGLVPGREASEGQSLAMIGYPAGLPAKYSPPASVALDGPALVLPIDAFFGDSGAPLFEPASGRVYGLLVSTTDPFYLANGCALSHVCSPGVANGIDVSRFNEDGVMYVQSYRQATEKIRANVPCKTSKKLLRHQLAQAVVDAYSDVGVDCNNSPPGEQARNAVEAQIAPWE